KALVNLVGVDLGIVILKREDNWDIVARHFTDNARRTNYSRTLLNHVLSERRTFYQDLGLAGPNSSLSDADAAVISPIFGLQDEVFGAQYGLRHRRPSMRVGGIRPLEAQVVQLMAAAVGANLARAKVSTLQAQLEQFFPPELARELENNQALLEG